jgi:hypothetical protein
MALQGEGLEEGREWEACFALPTDVGSSTQGSLSLGQP